MGSRNFLMLNWVHDELFVSEKVASVLKIVILWISNQRC